MALPFNIADETDRKKFENLMERWIDEDKSTHRIYWDEWKEAEDRLNGNVTPYGFTEEHTSKLEAENDPRSGRVEMKEFVHLNRERPNHESVLGDFLTIRRRLSITARHPKYRNIARVISERVKFIEDAEMLPETIYFPSMDGAFGKGLHWMKVSYNPTANKLRGKFDIDEVNAQEVYVDAQTKGAFFSKARRFTQLHQFRRADALVRFKRYPLYDDSRFSMDTEFDEPYFRTDRGRTWDDYSTFFEMYFAWPTQVYYLGIPKQGHLVEISEAEYMQGMQNPEMEKMLIDGGVEDRWYVSLYNRKMGCFHLQESTLENAALIPVINIQSIARAYPIGDVKNYAKLSDLLDVLVTVFLENAKKANIPIIPVNPEVMEDYAKELQHAARHGGPAPGATNVFYAQPVNQALVMLIPWVLGWIQDSVSKHSASMGELPAKQVAKETVQTLIAKDRTSHGRKDVTLKYALTMLAKSIVKLITQMETDPGWFNAVDPQPGEFSHIPINQNWSEQEYLAQLSELAQLPPPENEEQKAIYFEAIQKIRSKFEASNDVRTEMQPGFVVDGMDFTAEQLREFIAESKLSDEEFIGLYKPIATPIRRYMVNMLNRDVDLAITYTIEDDYENDKTFISNRAIMLNERGKMSGLDMLRAMGIANAEQIIENADNENQMLQLAKAISENPVAMQLVEATVRDPNFAKQVVAAMQAKAAKPTPQPQEA